MLIRSRPDVLAAQRADPARLRYAQLTPPKRGLFAAPKRVAAGIQRGASTPAGGIRAPGQVTFFRVAPDAPQAPAAVPAAPVTTASRQVPLLPASHADAEPVGLRALLGW